MRVPPGSFERRRDVSRGGYGRVHEGEDVNKRLHELFGLPDPETNESDSLPPAALVEAAYRYRLAVGAVGPSFYEAQSPKERAALELAGKRWLDAMRGITDEPTPSRMADQRALDPNRDIHRAEGRRLLAEALAARGVGTFSPEELQEYLGVLGMTNLLYEVGRGSLAVNQAFAWVEPPLRRFLELKRARDEALARPRPRGRSLRKGAEGDPGSIGAMDDRPAARAGR